MSQSMKIGRSKWKKKISTNSCKISKEERLRWSQISSNKCVLVKNIGKEKFCRWYETNCFIVEIGKIKALSSGFII
jgi:hypothetical protein